MREGYDRFEVDQTLSELEAKNLQLQRQLAIHKKQVDALQEQRDNINKRHTQLLGEVAVRERAAEEMSRLALREANSIIDNAHRNADMIVREAMSTARQILVEIARISNESSSLRIELKDKLVHLENVINDLDLPDAPDVRLFSDDQDNT